MNNLRRNACWNTEDARAILATEATEGSRRIFLATHSPFTDFDISGTHGGDIESPTEQAVLDTLSSPDIKHAFCVVEGEPGSGKSHLIRWLHIQWPNEDDLILLIQRADGSLEGTLRQLQHKLPQEHQHLFDSIGPRQDITLSGRARVFHTNLAHALRIDFFEKPLPDAEWCDKWGLANLLGKPEVLDAWKAPERILNVLSGKKGERNQELARFNLNDVAELETVIRPLSLGSIKAVRFGRMLQKETAGIQQLSKETKSDPASQETLRKDFETSYLLVDALNQRRNSAVQSLLGISSEGLKTLFMRLRRELKDRRLVLLLEDITAWEGVDNQLVDVLVTNVETREDNDLCPMVSVVGIAPEYLRSAGFRANYRQRITHYIRLGHESSAHEYQDVSSLRTPGSQIAFAAKYLRAVRAGLESLSTGDDDNNPVPNSCDSCSSRNNCLATLGEFQGVGLFPFNERAITTLYSTLEDPEHQSTLQTPRGMIQGVLVPTLTHPTVLDIGEYPGKEIETDWIPEENRRLSGLAPAIIQAKATEDNERDRLRRLVAYWGSEEESSTQRDDSDSLTFFAIRQGIYYAFGLPWLGGDEIEAPASVAEGQSPNVDVIEVEASKGATQKEPSGATSPPTTPSKLNPISRAELRKLANDVSAWMEGKKAANPSKLNRMSYEIITQLPWQRLGICDWLRDKLFTADTVILKGTKASRVQNLVIPEEQWAQLGLEAYANLKTARSELELQEEETYQRRYASMMRHLKKLATTHVQNRLSSVHDEKEWSISITLTQVLLVRAWLRGAVSPLAPSWQQWQAVLKQEDTPASNPNDRVDSWSDAVGKTSGSHGKLREMLRKWVILTQGDSSTQGISDPGDATYAVKQLRETFKLSPFPREVRESSQLAELSILVRDAREIHQRLPGIPKFEKDRLIRLGNGINTMLRHSTIREHIGRVDKIVQETRVQLPSAKPLAVSEWIKTYQRLKKLGYTNTTGDTPSQFVEDFIDGLSDVDLQPSDDAAAILDWALNAPASEIKTTHDGLNQGEIVIEDLLDFVEGFLSDLPSGVDSLDELHKIGDSLNTTSTLVLKKLRGVTNE